MKIEFNIGKKHLYAFAGVAIFIVAAIVIAQTVTQSHSADEIEAGTIAGALTITANGDVGIGNANPTEKLDVNGNIAATGNIVAEGDIAATGTICDTNGCIGSGGGGVTTDTDWTESDGDVYRSSGNVGIGTDEPTTKLDVDGDIRASGDICTDQGGGKCLSNDAGFGDGSFCIFKRSGSSCPDWAPIQEGLKLIGSFTRLDDERTGDSGHGYLITVCCTQ